VVRDLSAAVETTTPETTALRFGRPVEGSDGHLGKLTDLVVQPDTRRVTHLVVEDRAGKARLVPAELLVQEQRPDGVVVLSCSRADFATFNSIRSYSYVGFDDGPQAAKGTDIGVEDVTLLPSFGELALGGIADDFGSAYELTYDSIPSGSAELRSESMVVSEDRETLGNVDGLLVEGQRLTHVVVQRTHLWNTGAAAIPIDSVVAIGTDSVTVSLSDDAVAALDGAYPPWLPFA
jgi:sporulation protein YlmC with PRC-barrel domain